MQSQLAHSVPLVKKAWSKTFWWCRPVEKCLIVRNFKGIDRVYAIKLIVSLDIIFVFLKILVKLYLKIIYCKIREIFNVKNKNFAYRFC